MSTPNEGTVFVMDNTISPSNGQNNGAIRLRDSVTGASCVPDCPLPTVNGNYVLKVLNGVYSWIAETP